MPIRQKEEGDWKLLSNDEKKLLYRYSFRQTLAEFESPKGYWKPILAVCFFIATCATLYATFLNRFGESFKLYINRPLVSVYPPLPPTFQNEWKEAAMERLLVLGKGKFLGPPAHYDYEKNRWKNAAGDRTA
jgi:cytochrome c oxidase subunit 4